MNFEKYRFKETPFPNESEWNPERLERINEMEVRHSTRDAFIKSYRRDYEDAKAKSRATDFERHAGLEAEFERDAIEELGLSYISQSLFDKMYGIASDNVGDDYREIFEELKDLAELVRAAYEEGRAASASGKA